MGKPLLHVFTFLTVTACIVFYLVYAVRYRQHLAAQMVENPRASSFRAAESPETTVVYVLGMHHTATSIISNSLMRAGLYAGDVSKLLLADASIPWQQNTKFFEHQRAVDINDAIYSHFPSAGFPTWLGYQVDLTQLAGIQYNAFLEDAKELLHTLHHATAPSILKDPRMVLTLPLWLQAAKEEGYRVVCVITTRDPYQAVQSLAPWMPDTPAAFDAVYSVWQRATMETHEHCHNASAAVVNVSQEQLYASMEEFFATLHAAVRQETGFNLHPLEQSFFQLYQTSRRPPRSTVRPKLPRLHAEKKENVVVHVVGGRHMLTVESVFYHHPHATVYIYTPDHELVRRLSALRYDVRIHAQERTCPWRQICSGPLTFVLMAGIVLHKPLDTSISAAYAYTLSNEYGADEVWAVGGVWTAQQCSWMPILCEDVTANLEKVQPSVRRLLQTPEQASCDKISSAFTVSLGTDDYGFLPSYDGSSLSVIRQHGNGKGKPTNLPVDGYGTRAEVWHVVSRIDVPHNMRTTSSTLLVPSSQDARYAAVKYAVSREFVFLEDTPATSIEAMNIAIADAVALLTHSNQLFFVPVQGGVVLRSTWLERAAIRQELDWNNELCQAHMPVQRQDTRLHTSTLTIVTVLKNEAHNLPEWIAYHVLQGFDHFILYDDGSTDDLQQAMSPFVSAGYVTLRSVGTLSSRRNDKDVSTQTNCYSDALQRANSVWMAFIDVDEFIVPQLPNNTVASVLEEQLQDSAVGGMLLRTVLFGSSGRKASIRDDQLVMEAYRHRADTNWLPPRKDADLMRFRQCKSVVRPDVVRATSNAHEFEYTHGYYAVDDDGKRMCAISVFSTPTKLMLAHFKTKSLEDYERKRELPVVQGTPQKWEWYANTFSGADRNEVRDERLASYAYDVREWLDALYHNRQQQND